MAETDDDPSDQFGIFISGDGHRVTDAPWRLQPYDEAGPLSASQISDLADRIGLGAALLSKLSERLGFVLNPEANVHAIPLSPSKARQAAKSDLAFARKQLTAMRAKLIGVIERLSSLTSEDDDDEGPYSPPYARMLIDLEAGLESVTRAAATLEGLDGPKLELARWEPLDRRHLHDRRRDEVLGGDLPVLGRRRPQDQVHHRPPDFEATRRTRVLRPGGVYLSH